MKKLVLVFVILMLAACQVPSAPDPASTYPSDATQADARTPKSEPAAQEFIENEKTSKEQPSETIEEPLPPPPLQMKLMADTTEAQLKLFTTLQCLATDGVPPYTYLWSSKENNIDVTKCQNKESCDILIQKMGNYQISCAVSDGNQRLEDSVDLKVIKEQVKIDSIISVGDSLTFGHGLQDPVQQRWPQLYANTLKNAKVYNYAISGDTTFGTLEQLKRLEQDSVALDKEKSKLIFLWIGANDIKSFIAPEDYAVNYALIIKKLQEIENAKLILITIPDVSKLRIADDINTGINDILNQLGVQGQLDVKTIGQDVINQYNARIKQTGKVINAPVIDMFDKMKDFDQSLISSDEFHPNKKGHERIAYIVQESLEDFYPKKDFI